MKKFFFLTILSFMSMFALHAQRFQVTTGTQLADEKWAVIQDSAIGGYVTIGNVSNTAGVRQAWISSYNTNGVVVTSAIATTGRQLIARDICLAPSDSTNGKRSYYITGWTQASVNGAIVSQMFVARIRLDGSFIWWREDPIAGQGMAKEGVAVARAANGDVVVASNVAMPASGNIPAGSRIMMSRFSPAGGVMWSNVYNLQGNWMVRELANGVPSPNCAPSPTTMPGEFVITGEVNLTSVTGGGRPATFVAVYNGAGTECWKNVYPANLTALNITADAGYDVVYNTITGNYSVAGVAQTNATRASAASTPYMLEVSTGGALVTGSVYLGPNNNPLGLYPRCIARGVSTPGTAGTQLVVAGPDFGKGLTFMAKIPAVGAAGAFFDYAGFGTANSVAQPFILNDAQPEGILSAQTAKPGYLVSTNSLPAGSFGQGDGHFIRTDLAGQTPDGCPGRPVANVTLSTSTSTSVQSTLVNVSQSGFTQATNFNYPVLQKFCVDTCTVASSYTFTQSGSVVNFTGTGSGNGTITYNWNFGDLTTSNLQNPTHTYASPGTYNACLTVINTLSNGDTCTSSTCRTITVAKPCDIEAGFTYKVACKYKVSFVNTSTGTGPVTYKWIFDDGTISTLSSPTKTFAKCGIHRTYLIVCNPVCCDTIGLDVDIPCCKVVTDFCLQDSGLYVKLLYSTTMNLPTTTYSVYVDGVLTSWTANAYKALTAGVHTICLKARRVSCPGDTCCATCCKTINVHAGCTLNADFWYLIETTGAVVFYNKTTPAGYTSSWEFGDGSPTVTTTAPTHIYTPGTYTACLTTTIVTGTDTCRSRVCKTFTIETPCKVSAKFKSKYCLATPLTVEFINFSVGGTAYFWDFGDGTNSILANPVHNYAATGAYIVCLIARGGHDCWSKTCYRVIVSTTSCDSSCTNLPSKPTFKLGQNLVQPGEILNDMSLEGSTINANGVTKDNINALKAEPAKPKAEDKLSLFPNPASQKVQVVFETATEANGEISVTTAMGSLVYRKSVSFAEGKNQFSIPLNTLANGSYFLKINSGSNIHSTIFSVKN